MTKAERRVTGERHSGPTPAPTPHGRFVCYAGPIGAILLALAAYANSLRDGFVYDDPAIILRNPAVLEEYNGRAVPWYEAWRRPYWPDTNAKTGQDVLYRPLTVQTYAWDMRFLGPNPWWFHLVNVGLHALASLGAWWLARRLCRSDAAGLIAGWLFAVHPIHTEAVTSIVGRAEILATVGTLGALFALDRLLHAERRPATVAWGLVTVLAAAAAVFSKESGAAVIPIAAMFAWWLLRTTTARRRTLRAVVVLAATLVVFGIYLQMRYDVCGGRLRVAGQMAGAGNVLRETAGLPRLLTPLSLVGRYVGLMLWPGRLLADYSYAVVRPTASPLEPYFLLGLITLILMAVAAVRSLRTEAAPAVATVGWLASYFFVSNSVILIAVMMAERWFYAPSLWMLVLLVMGGEWLLARYAGREHLSRLIAGPAPRMLFAGVVIALGARTWVRNADWRNTVTLFEHDLRSTSPPNRSAFFASALAAIRMDEGRFAEAEQLAREAVASYPESANIQCDLAEVLLATSRPAEALKVAVEARRIAPNDPRATAVFDAAQSAAEGIDLKAKLRDAQERIARDPNDARAYLAAADALERMGQFASAAEHYQRATQLDANSLPAWLGWGRTLASLNRSGEAVAVYEKIVARWPGPEAWEAHANLALQLMDKARGKLYQPERAIEHAERALQLAPAELRMQLTVNLAEVCANCGHRERAIGLFERVIRQLAPNDPQRRRLSERVEFLRKGG